MAEIISVILNATMLSAMYALIAIGLTLIYGVGGVFNLAHGVTVTLGAYSAFLVTTFGYNIWLAVAVAILVPAVFNAILYLGLIEPIEEKAMVVMVVTLLFELNTQFLVRNFLGTEARAVPSLVTGRLSFLGITVQNNRVVAFVISWVVIIALLVLINRTHIGRKITAVSMSKKGSKVVGVDQKRVYLYTWVIAGMLAGIAGVFFGSLRSASWSIGLDALLIAFPIVVLGGIGSIRGSIVAAYVLGFIDVFMVSYVNIRLSGVAPLLVFVAILLLRPQGIFGREVTM
jgi:branched-chain amino acid transport system permease protein